MSLSTSLHTQAQPSRLRLTPQRMMKPSASSVWGLLDRAWVSLFPPKAFSLPLLILNSIIFSWRYWRSSVRTPLHPTTPFPPLVAQAQLQLWGGASAFTPVAAGVGASAFIPVAVGGNNPTRPDLPTFFVNANTTPSVVNSNSPLVQNFLANQGTLQLPASSLILRQETLENPWLKKLEQVPGIPIRWMSYIS
jgi:hypothetical protein